MNIFVTDECPVKSAAALDDLRLNKMISESIQMLSIAVSFRGSQSLCDSLSWGPVPNDLTSPKAYVNHPCSVWARKSKQNYLWLADHCQAMVDLRETNGKENCNAYKLENCWLVADNLSFPEEQITPFVYCGVTDEKSTVIESYRNLLNYKWAFDKKPPVWTDGTKPLWYEKELANVN